MSKKNAAFAAVLVVIAAGFWLFWKKPAGINQPKKSFTVGVVSFGGAHKEVVSGLIEGMKSLGYEEGINIFYDIVDAGGSDEKARQAAEKFLDKNVDAVYTASTPVTKQAAEVIKTIPIVFNIVSDPVAAGFAKSAISSGTNLTGCSNYVGQTGPKRLEILKEILPKAKNVLVIYDPDNSFSQKALTTLNEGGTETLGIKITARAIHSKDEVIQVMRSLTPGEFDAFFHLGEAKVSAASEEVIDAANYIKLPTIAHEEGLVRRGMLAAYGPSWQALGRQCAATLDKVLKGVKPADIPIQIPERIELTVNLKTAKALGLDIPEKILFSADKFIE